MNTKEYNIWTVYCRCGEKLVKYRKRGPGRLIKIHRDRIAKDYNNLFLSDSAKIGTNISCPKCKKRLATVQKVSGKYVNKINQGQLGIIKK